MPRQHHYAAICRHCEFEGNMEPQIDYLNRVGQPRYLRHDRRLG